MTINVVGQNVIIIILNFINGLKIIIHIDLFTLIIFTLKFNKVLKS